MTLDEIRAKLRLAATAREPVRFGHEVARTLYEALADVAADGGDEPPHEHAWGLVTHERSDEGWSVLQGCACGEMRALAVAP